MPSFNVRYTKGAKEDIKQLYQFLLNQDINAAKHALSAIGKITEFLQDFPFSCRKADEQNPFLREVLIPFGSSGYVALFEIKNNNTVTILVARHQREDDYH
jgi:plasmid stabilization system protein ParE